MATKTTGTYTEGIGRRKSAVARVRITESTKQGVVVNGKGLNEYFVIADQQAAVLSPLTQGEHPKQFEVSAKVVGGGIRAQADAIRHGIARALTSFDETLRKELKQAGFLKRDPRRKERKKFGLKKARKAPQWSKR
jgi:small subunit ribosomal protein S9